MWNPLAGLSHKLDAWLHRRALSHNYHRSKLSNLRASPERVARRIAHLAERFPAKA